MKLTRAMPLSMATPSIEAMTSLMSMLSRSCSRKATPGRFYSSRLRNNGVATPVTHAVKEQDETGNLPIARR